MRHARYSSLLAGLVLWTGCQKSDPEVPSAAAAPKAPETKTAAVEVSPVLSLEEEAPALYGKRSGTILWQALLVHSPLEVASLTIRGKNQFPCDTCRIH